MNPVFQGQFKNGEFKLAEGERERIAQYSRGQKDGDAEMVLRPKRRRSIPYHRYFFGVIVNMCARHFQTPQISMYIMLMQQFRPLPNDAGELKFMGISKMETPEMIILGEEIRNYMLHEHHVYIPEPNEIDMEAVNELASRYA